MKANVLTIDGIRGCKCEVFKGRTRRYLTRQCHYHRTRNKNNVGEDVIDYTIPIRDTNTNIENGVKKSNSLLKKERKKGLALSKIINETFLLISEILDFKKNK